MKIQVLSDLHLEFDTYEYTPCGADVIVLAGDIHLKDKGVEWAIHNLPDVPVIYVLGNHEFYGSAYPKLVSKLKEKSKGTNVRVLENDSILIDGVNFIGCTLWTNFELFGDPRIAGYECQGKMTDYKKIRISPRYSKLRSLDTAIIHRQSLNWIEDQLGQFADGANVVVTHHAPSSRSIPEGSESDIISAAYASELDATILEYRPGVWIHGHMHNSLDYVIGSTRVVCNPRGYPGERNPDFDNQFVVNYGNV